VVLLDKITTLFLDISYQREGPSIKGIVCDGVEEYLSAIEVGHHPTFDIYDQGKLTLEKF